MRKTIFFLFFPLFLQAQADTTIYQIVEEMPRLPVCEDLDTTLQFKYTCAQGALLNFITQNIQYPFEAREQDIEGTVVLSFVVEPDGLLSNFEIVRDIGGGCGPEALRVAQALNQTGVRWIPGKNAGKAVRTKYTVPVKFKLEEPPPYVLIGRDTVYVELDTVPVFKQGNEVLASYLQSRVVYPKSGLDSCRVGDMDLQMLVFPNGYVEVLDLSDYNLLGADFQFEAIRVASSTMAMWLPATYQQKPVTATVDIHLDFYPSTAGCAQKVADYKRANELADQGGEKYNAGEKEPGLALLDQAIGLFPENARFRYVRGQILLNEGRTEEACTDLKLARAGLPGSLLDNFVPVICK